MRTLILILITTITLLADKTSVIEVAGMHCPLCTTSVKKAVKKVDGVKSVKVRLNLKRVFVVYDDSVEMKEILDAIATTSYKGVVISTN